MNEASSQPTRMISSKALRRPHVSIVLIQTKQDAFFRRRYNLQLMIHAGYTVSSCMMNEVPFRLFSMYQKDYFIHTEALLGIIYASP